MLYLADQLRLRLRLRLYQRDVSSILRVKVESTGAETHAVRGNVRGKLSVAHFLYRNLYDTRSQCLKWHYASISLWEHYILAKRLRLSTRQQYDLLLSSLVQNIVLPATYRH
jgi:hypothetical protein